MNFEQLLYAEILSHHQSMQKAADILHISKSGLSLAISQLEEELGVKIFERTPAGTTVSKEGQTLLAFISDILRAKNALESNAAYISKPDHFQKVTIHYMNVMLKPFMTDFIENYTSKYKNTTLDISCHELTSIIQRVQNQEIDAGFIAIKTSNTNTLSGLDFTPVCHSKLVMLCSPKNPLLKKAEISLEDLKQQRFSLFNDSFHDMIFERLQNICGPLPLVLRVDDIWAMTEAIHRLNTVCFGRIVQGKLSSTDDFKGLCQIDIGHIIDDQFTLGWLTNPNHMLSKQAQKLIKTITKTIKRDAN